MDTHPEANVPVADSGDSVGSIREALARGSFASATDLVVVRDSRVVGLVPVETLLAADPQTPVGGLLETEPVILLEGADQEQAVRRVAAAGGRSITVVDAEGRFRGLLPPERLLAVLAAEHDEDLARLAGYLTTTAAARAASEERVARRLWHRLPWLGLGLAGAMASAGIVASFEDALRDEVLLAVFVPAVVYMADAVGTQTEAIVIRGLAVGTSLRNIALREAITGLVIGALLGALFFPFALAIWGNERVAASVALALLASCSIATIVAMGLPYLLARLGRDPAFGSGPLATVIQDLLSIVVYFSIATALLP
ncbi:MAG TPA: magnesium transporter [Gaiella sp.]|uniref:magnesium transporter n=1 Tax=Gaiella sp. TaxID=2663207 RepID=UPI002D7E5CAB|nr:magnesium transporter [Gaiella sp.]HET9287918.1 magnesium transporter [Gaiella sp.]